MRLVCAPLLMRRLLPRALWAALGIVGPLLLLAMSLTLAGQPASPVSAQPNHRLFAPLAPVIALPSTVPPVSVPPHRRRPPPFSTAAR